MTLFVEYFENNSNFKIKNGKESFRFFKKLEKNKN